MLLFREGVCCCIKTSDRVESFSSKSRTRSSKAATWAGFAAVVVIAEFCDKLVLTLMKFEFSRIIEDITDGPLSFVLLLMLRFRLPFSPPLSSPSKGIGELATDGGINAGMAAPFKALLYPFESSVDALSSSPWLFICSTSDMVMESPMPSPPLDDSVTFLTTVVMLSDQSESKYAEY